MFLDGFEEVDLAGADCYRLGLADAHPEAYFGRGRRGFGWGLGHWRGRFLGGAACGECGARSWAVLLAASVGRALSPSASVVVLLKSDFLAYYY
jgi:hypothetical protein